MYVRIHVGSVLDYVSRYLLSIVMYSVIAKSFFLVLPPIILKLLVQLTKAFHNGR